LLEAPLLRAHPLEERDDPCPPAFLIVRCTRHLATRLQHGYFLYETLVFHRSSDDVNRMTTYDGLVSEPAEHVLDATIRVLATVGWEQLSLERVADAAGVSRVTLWRQGVTRESLVDALLARLAHDYRDTMWAVLTAPGTGRERLERALAALCSVADRHLDLLLASDSAFHRAWSQTQSQAQPQVSFLGPFIRIVEDGVADGTLRDAGEPQIVADVLFNTVCWPYVHLRGRHEWTPADASARVIGLVLDGVAS
jgi:AcrR family transcriptional regulator